MSLVGGLLRLQTVTPVPEKRRRFGWCKDANNLPLVKRVMLFDNSTGEYKGSTTSRASDGYWELLGMDINLPEHSIVTIAIDDTRVYDSVVRDHKSLVV